eukprot:CAMPEP_0170573044 /NCGR_PEP_ID=MMETSP0224-20130122/2551_1 /TAXON_ID=285029 /ORGANISM="Togula jolla, Strain CCCM 725" /LENGTH=392 /DNA_ID=CAMNT_0010895597 /DNA_START=23 /DNA_END=1201 /DNA_ORIENTATION=-
MDLPRMIKSVRLLRVMRSLRLLRVIKVFQVPAEMLQAVKSDFLRTFLDIACLFLLLVVISHFIACGWYLIAMLSPEESWARLQLAERYQQSIAYRYSASVHWAVTQFTLTSIEIHAISVPERWYSICVLFLALVFFSFGVSRVTTSMSVLWQTRKEKMQDAIANRIQHFLREHYSKAPTLHEVDVPVLKILPDTLMMKLHTEVFLPTASIHPLIAELQRDSVGIREVCHHAMAELPTESKVSIFHTGSACTKMYFIAAGDVGYRNKRGERQLDEDRKWLCEAPLWMPWWNRGTAIAYTSCDVIVLDCTKFGEIVSCRPDCWSLPVKRYAAFFVDHVQGDWAHATDLPEDPAVLTELIQMSFMKMGGHGHFNSASMSATLNDSYSISNRFRQS